MDTDTFINAAMDAGASTGINALDAEQRLVFLISEAEVLCDMEGIDSFLNRYAPIWIAEAAAAFEAVGALEIAAELRAAPIGAPVGDSRLDRLNQLIVGRVGYDYEALRRVIDKRRRTKRRPDGSGNT